MLPAKISALIRDLINVYLKAQGYRLARFGQRFLANYIHSLRDAPDIISFPYL